MFWAEHSDFKLNGHEAWKWTIKEKKIYEEIGIANLETIFFSDKGEVLSEFKYEIL